MGLKRILPFSLEITVQIDASTGKEINKELKLMDEDKGTSLTDFEKAIFLHGGFPDEIILSSSSKVPYTRKHMILDSDECREGTIVRKIFYYTYCGWYDRGGN